MANLSLFDKAGHWTEPSVEALAAVTDAERDAIAHVRDAAHALDAANVAFAENESALKSTQAEIAAFEKRVPKIDRITLVKQMMADTQKRRAGL